MLLMKKIREWYIWNFFKVPEYVLTKYLVVEPIVNIKKIFFMGTYVFLLKLIVIQTLYIIYCLSEISIN